MIVSCLSRTLCSAIGVAILRRPPAYLFCTFVEDYPAFPDTLGKRPPRYAQRQTGRPDTARKKRTARAKPDRPAVGEEQEGESADVDRTHKSIRVSLVGMPNAGKSELANQLLDRPLNAVSCKVHTTRRRLVGVTAVDNTEVIVVDTPGVDSLRHLRSLPLKEVQKEVEELSSAENQLKNADMVLAVVDAYDCVSKGRRYHRLLHLLYRNQHIPAVLVLNKVDLLKDKRRLIEATHELTGGIVGGVPIGAGVPAFMRRRSKFVLPQRPNVSQTPGDGDTEVHDLQSDGVALAAGCLPDSAGEKEQRAFLQARRIPVADISFGMLNAVYGEQRGFPHFEEVFMVSALLNDGVQDLKRFLQCRAQNRKWSFQRDFVTRKSPKDVVYDMLRAELLDELPKEVPYRIDLKITNWEVDEVGCLHVLVDADTKLERLAKMLLGPRGERIKRIVDRCKRRLSQLYEREVNLKIGVRPANAAVIRAVPERTTVGYT